MPLDILRNLREDARVYLWIIDHACRIEDGLAPDSTGIAVLGGVGLLVVPVHQALALGGGGGADVDGLGRGDASVDNSLRENSVRMITSFTKQASVLAYTAYIDNSSRTLRRESEHHGRRQHVAAVRHALDPVAVDTAVHAAAVRVRRRGWLRTDEWLDVVEAVWCMRRGGAFVHTFVFRPVAIHGLR